MSPGDTGNEYDRFSLWMGVNFGVDGQCSTSSSSASPTTDSVNDVDGFSHSISVGNPNAVMRGAETTGVE